MNTTTHPELRELIAKNILLSFGGTINPRPGELVFPVREDNGNIVEKSVGSIFFSPGKEHGGFFLYFTKGFSKLTDEEDFRKVWSYILDEYCTPDYDIASDSSALTERLALRELNLSFISQHGDLEPGDMRMIRAYKKAVESAREAVKGNPVPLPGDTVEGVYYGIHTFGHGVIDSHRGFAKPLSICASPYVPFIGLCGNDGDEVSLSVSGGPFFSINSDDLEYLGEDEREFCDFGHCGPCAGGAVHFVAKVNRWKVKDGVLV